MRAKTSRKTRVLGQHILVSDEIAEKIVEAAQIKSVDRVLEIGTGTGTLTRRIIAKGVFTSSYEIDKSIFERVERTFSDVRNLELHRADVFADSIDTSGLNICITSLPYSRSLAFVKWLALRSPSFETIIAVIQSEFADKLASKPGTESYRAVSVLAQLSFKMEQLFSISREKFLPPPKVSSKVVRFRPLSPEPFFNVKRIRLLDSLFSFRGRLLSSALAKIRPDLTSAPSELTRQRIEKISPSNYAQLIDLLTREEGP